MEYVATMNKTLSYDGVSAIASVEGVASNLPKYKAGGYNILYGTMSVTLTGISDGTYVNPGPIILTISPSSKNKLGGMEGSAVLRENDSSSVSVSLTDPGNPPLVPPKTKTVTISVTIESAGQTEVKSE